jgi:hypothetical protein
MHLRNLQYCFSPATSSFTCRRATDSTAFPEWCD